jgi:hypothetical protein
MTAAAAALHAARAAGVTVTRDGQHLSLAAPIEPPADLLALLRQHKPAIIELLQYDVTAWSDAITTRLDLDRPPTDVSPSRWEQFVADCRAFVKSEWADKAAALGWDARALFGCRRDRPWMVQWWGAVWFINGGTLLAMTDTTMSLQTTHGARQSLRRMEHPYDFIVPVWEVA